MLNKTDQELIERYFDGDLTQEEEAKVEEKKKQDNAFRDAFYFHESIISTIREEAWRETFRQWDQQMEKKNIWMYISKTRYIAAAVLVVLIASSMYFWLIMPDSLDQPASQELYAQYYEPYPNVLYAIQRGESVVNEDAPSRYFAQYERGEFEEAYEGFNKLLDENPDNHDIRFYLALTSLELNQTEEAINNFVTIVEHTNGYFRFRNQSFWYLSLAYLREGQTDKAYETLQVLIENNHNESYTQKAEELISKL